MIKIFPLALMLSVVVAHAQVTVVDDFTQGNITLPGGYKWVTSGDETSILGGHRYMEWNRPDLTSASASINGDGKLRVETGRNSLTLTYGSFVTSYFPEFRNESLNMDLSGKAFRFTIDSMNVLGLRMHILYSFWENGVMSWGGMQYDALRLGTFEVPFESFAPGELSNVSAISVKFPVGGGPPAIYEFSRFEIVPIPEPGQWAILGGLGLLGFGMLHRARRTSE